MPAHRKAQIGGNRQVDTAHAPVELARVQLGARLRAARAILGWSQTDLARMTGLTQRSIYRIEQASTDVRRSTALLLDDVITRAGIRFEERPDGGLSFDVPAELLAGAPKGSGSDEL